MTMAPTNLPLPDEMVRQLHDPSNVLTGQMLKDCADIIERFMATSYDEIATAHQMLDQLGVPKGKKLVHRIVLLAGKAMEDTADLITALNEQIAELKEELESYENADIPGEDN